MATLDVLDGIESHDAGAQLRAIEQIKRLAGSAEEETLEEMFPEEDVLQLSRRMGALLQQGAPDSRVGTAIVELLDQTMAGFGDEALDACVGDSLPALVEALAVGDRRASAFSALMQYSGIVPSPPHRLVDALVDHGMTHADAAVRREATAAAPRLVHGTTPADGRGGSEEGGLTGIAKILDGVVGRLRDVDEGVLRAAQEAVVRIRQAVPAFFPLLGQLSVAQQQLLAEHEDRVLGVARPMSPDSMEDGTEESGGGVFFGFLPAALHARLTDTRPGAWKGRAHAVTELQELSKRLDRRAVQGHLPDLLDFVVSLLDDEHFRVSMGALALTGVLARHLGPELQPHLSLVVPTLLDRLGDTSSESRQQAQLVLQGLIDSLGLSSVVPCLVPALHQSNWRTREEALRALCYGLLTTRKGDPPLTRAATDKLRPALLLILEDAVESVAAAALETVAVLEDVLRNASSRLDDVIDLQTLPPFVANGIIARLRQPALPELRADGWISLSPAASAAVSPIASYRSSAARPRQLHIPSTANMSMAQYEASLFASPTPIRGQRGGGEAEAKEDWHRELFATPSPGRGLRRSPFPNSEPPPMREGYVPSWSGGDAEVASAVGSGKPWDALTPQGRRSQSVSASPDVDRTKLSALKARRGRRAGSAPGQKPSAAAAPAPLEVGPRSTPTARFTGMSAVPEGSSTPTPAYSDPADRPIRPMASSTAFVDPSERPIQPMGAAAASYEYSDPAERPIKPLRMDPFQEQAAAFSPGVSPSPVAPAPKKTHGVSAATRRRRERQQAEEERLRALHAPAGREAEAEAASEESDEEVVAKPKPKPKPARRPRPRSREQPREHRERDPPPSALKAEATYLDSSQIAPSPNVSAECRPLMGNLRSEEWSIAFEALNSVRRLALHHQGMLERQLHAVVLLVIEQVNNLRSSVAKNALLCCADMFTGMGRMMDAEVDGLLPVLLKRAADTNAFLSESAAVAIERMLHSVTDHRALTGLLGCCATRQPAVRARVAHAIDACIALVGARVTGYRDLDRLIAAVGRFVNEPSTETRAIGRRAAIRLVRCGVDEGRMKRCMPGESFGKIKSVLDKGQGDEVLRRGGAPSVVAAPAGRARRTPASSPARGSALNISQSERLEQLVTGAAVSDWRARIEGVRELTRFIVQHHAAMEASGRLLNAVDLITARLADGNSKVVLAAVECAEELVTGLGARVEPALNTFVPALASTLTSANRAACAGGERVLDLLARAVPASALLQSFATVAEQGAQRVRLCMLERLQGMVPEASPPKLTRYVLPVALRTLAVSKGDVAAAARRLVRELQRALGDDAVQTAMASMRPREREELEGLL